MTCKKLPTLLGPQLEQLAIAIATELKLPGALMDERIAGFRALTAYYAMINKLPPPVDDTKGGFGGYKDTIRNLGGSAPRADRTNGADSF